MARQFALVVVFAATLFASASSMSSTEFGMSMASRAFDVVCWYDTLKVFPKTNSNGFGQCSGQGENVKSQIVGQIQDEKSQQKYFGDWMQQMAMGSISSDYTSACGSLLKDANAKATADESSALNDGQSGAYPFQAFSYCLLQQVRKNHGEKAISAIKDEKTHKRKHWMMTLLDRDNEFRARHGDQPFQLTKELNDQAQLWADKNAAECNMHHSTNDYPDRQWNGDSTGESLSGGGGKVAKEDAAYIASDGWYEEIGSYPYPAYTGNNQDSTFESIGHFTQSVWKGTKYVGYGFAHNPDCEAQGAPTFYVVGRYSPPGNYQGAYLQNVAPPS